jgi:hypothetical protein
MRAGITEDIMISLASKTSERDRGCGIACLDEAFGKLRWQIVIQKKARG